MIRKVITSYDNFSAMIAIMIRIKFKPFPACRYAKTGNGGYTFGLHIIRRRGYCSTGLIPRISSSGSPSLRTNWSVASITTSTPSSTRLSDTTFVFSPLSSVSSSPAFILQDADGCQLVPVHVFRLERRVVFLVHFHVLILLGSTFVLL